MKYLLFGISIISVLLALLPHIVYLLAKLVGLVAHFRVSPIGFLTRNSIRTYDLQKMIIWIYIK